MKQLLTLLFSLLLFTANSSLWPCFDTFLILHNKSFVYPKSTIAADTLGEYSVNNSSIPNDDSYFSSYNLYYGISKKFSIQAGMETAETRRNENTFKAAAFNARGTYNLLSNIKGIYFSDVILEHQVGFDGTGNTLGFSSSNIFNASNFTFVLHPVMSVAYSKTQKTTIGGHSGLFYNMAGHTVIGMGMEYSSAQNGSAFSNKIIEGEAGASLFWGVLLGNFYIQSEFAKGLQNARDYGFALSLKGFMDLSKK